MSIDFELIKKLTEERDKLLESKPELQELQKTIDKRLKNCNNKHNRLVIINDLMMASFKEMREGLLELQTALKAFTEGTTVNSKPNLKLLKDKDEN